MMPYEAELDEMIEDRLKGAIKKKKDINLQTSLN